MKMLKKEKMVSYLILAVPLALFLQYFLPPFLVAGISDFEEIDFSIIKYTSLAISLWIIAFFLRNRLVLKEKKLIFRCSKKKWICLNIIVLITIASPIAFLWHQAGSLPILEALLGASPSGIYEARLKYDLMQSGVSLLPLYIYILSSTILLPLVVLNNFIKNNKKKWILLVIASIALVSGFSKAAFFKIIFPVLFFQLASRRSKELLVTIFSTVLFFLFISFLFNGGVYRIINKETQDMIRVDYLEYRQERLEEVGFNALNDNYVFGSVGILGIVNRVLWVPYVTAKSWILYDKAQNLESVRPIISNRSLSYLFGAKYIPLESLIFNYQYGIDNDKINGLANTSYFIDALVKYGWAGFFISIAVAPFLFTFILMNIQFYYKGLLIFFIPLLAGGSLLNFFLTGGVVMLLLSLMKFIDTDVKKSEAVGLRS